jgi:hypothetical protein
MRGNIRFTNRSISASSGVDLPGASLRCTLPAPAIGVVARAGACVGLAGCTDGEDRCIAATSAALHGRPPVVDLDPDAWEVAL